MPDERNKCDIWLRAWQQFGIQARTVVRLYKNIRSKEAVYGKKIEKSNYTGILS